MKNINALSGKNAEHCFRPACGKISVQTLIKQNGTEFCSIVLGLRSPLQGGD
jgi:hypothetical protein